MGFTGKMGCNQGCFGKHPRVHHKSDTHTLASLRFSLLTLLSRSLHVCSLSLTSSANADSASRRHRLVNDQMFWE